MSKTSWSLSALRSFIRSDRQELVPLVQVIDSIGRVDEIFHYHLYSARDALKGIVGATGSIRRESMDLVLNSADSSEEFWLARVASEAHLIGSIQATRSMLDMYAQLVNGLVLPEPLTVERCDIWKVCSRMPESSLKDSIEGVLRCYWFKYINGFINTTKHRKLVNHEFRVSFVDDTVGVRIGPFAYNDEEFCGYPLKEALQGTVDVKNSIGACGRALNRYCIDEP